MAAGDKRTATKLATASNKTAQMKKGAVRRQAADAQAATKKLGQESSSSRIALLDATEQLLREQGFASITSRTIAEKAGVKFQLIFYYFNSMDDLYVEVFRRGAEADLERLNAATRARHPIRAMWKLSTDPKSARFATEYITIANHIDAVRAEISRYAKKRRKLQAEIISHQLAERGITPKIPPLVTAFLMENMARGLLLESALNVTLGHQEAKVFADVCLRLLEEGGDISTAAEGLVSHGAPAAKAARKPTKRATR
jgi:AcrR family transcriptional regulator